MKIDLTIIDRNHIRPLHEQLASVVRDAIKAGHYKPGERIEPERQFMSTGKLSNNTVTRAFNDLAAEGLVVRKVGSGTYVADRVARLETERKCVGIFHYGCWSEFYQRLLQGVQEECRQQGAVHIPLFPEQFREGSEELLCKELSGRNAGGLLACPSLLMVEDYHRKVIREMIRRMPVVLMDVYLPEIACDVAMTDNEEASYQLARHLLDLGHRNLAFVTHSVRYPYVSSIQDRIVGLKRALCEAYIEPEDDCVVGFRHTLGSLPEHEVYVRQAVHSLLERPKSRRPTAILCVNDSFAVCVMQSLHERGVSIPEEMSVTGFDDLSLADHLEPPLTTVAQPLERIGRLAARLLLRRLDEPTAPPARHYLDGMLRIRRSTGRPARAGNGRRLRQTGDGHRVSKPPGGSSARSD